LYWYPRKYSGKSVKWQRSYTGPYLVIRDIAPVNVVLQRSQKSKPFVVHVNKLKKCMGVTLISWLGGEIPEPELAADRVPVASASGVGCSTDDGVVGTKRHQRMSLRLTKLRGNSRGKLPFWALGLRSTPRSGPATPRPSSAVVPATESVTESCPRSSEVQVADLPAPVPTGERAVPDLATLKLPVPIPQQDPEFEAHYAMSPISESGVPAGSEAGVRTPGSKDWPLTIEANDDDLDEDLPSAPPPAVEPRTPVQPSGAASARYPGVGIVRKKKTESPVSTAQDQTPASSLSSLAALLARPPVLALVSTAQPLPAPGNAATTSNRLREMSEEDWKRFEEFRMRKRQKNN